jgi:hypothetical protein
MTFSWYDLFAATDPRTPAEGRAVASLDAILGEATTLDRRRTFADCVSVDRNMLLEYDTCVRQSNSFDIKVNAYLSIVATNEFGLNSSIGSRRWTSASELRLAVKAEYRLAQAAVRLWPSRAFA